MEATLKIRAGYDIAFNCFQEVPMLLMLSVHPSRQQDLLTDHVIRFSPNVQARDFRDAFGNVCTRLVAPPGLIEIRNEFLIADSGLPDEINSRLNSGQWATCPMRPLGIYWEADIAIHRNFRIRHGRCSAGFAAAGNGLRQSAITFMISIKFGYHHARCDRTASEGHRGTGRCLSRLRSSGGHVLPLHEYSGEILHRISGRYRRAARSRPMDFSAWFEVFLDGRWYTFDARHNHPRIGRIVIARGRDAADVAISTTFGSAALARFTVVTDEVIEDARAGQLLETAA